MFQSIAPDSNAYPDEAFEAALNLIFDRKSQDDE